MEEGQPEEGATAPEVAEEGAEPASGDAAEAQAAAVEEVVVGGDEVEAEAEAAAEPADAPVQEEEPAPSQEPPPPAAEAEAAGGADADAAAPPAAAESPQPAAVEEPAPVDTSLDGAVDEALLHKYLDLAHAAGRKANYLVQRSLEESIQAQRGTFFVDAPGSHKMVFSSRLGDEDMPVFAQAFGGMAPVLTRLDLSYNLLTDVGAQQLATALLGPRARSLSSLSVRSNSIGPAGCQALCQALKQCPSLLRFDISHNPLERKGGLMVIELLKECPNILELFLADTSIDIDVLVALASMLLVGTPSQLRLCDLENPRIGTLQEDHTVHLAKMLRVNTHLSEVRLRKHRMRDEGVRQLVSFLIENKTLRILDLRCNELGAEGAKHLGVLLASDCQLSQLNLSGNRIGEKGNLEGARALASALLSNRMLRHLDLNHNGLCGQALQLLAEAIDQNSTLESVGLFHSEWDQPSSFKFHQILNDRARILPLKADFVTSEVDLRIDICKVDDAA